MGAEHKDKPTIDFAKFIALRRAGWTPERIAENYNVTNLMNEIGKAFPRLFDKEPL